jgi:hypothetical protein
MSLRTLLPAALILAFAPACSSTDEGGTEKEPVEIDEVTGLPRCDEANPTGKPCVDPVGAKICPANTGYPGDDFALCQPDPDEGMLLHYGPKDYDDVDDVATYLIAPGVEDENCMFVHTPNAIDRHVTNYHGRMRPNSHHLIVTSLDADVPDSTVPGPCALTDAVGARWLVGAQDPQIDVSIGGLGKENGADVPKVGDPDYGLAQTIGANTPLRLDLHYINTDSETVLREAWVTFDYVEEKDVVNLVDMITFFQGVIDVPPQGAFTTAAGKCTAPTDRYLGLLTAHAHKALTRSTVWHEKLDGSRTKVYETFDWFEPGNLYYRDGVDNPIPNEAQKSMGGSSGFAEIKAGESLIFDCQYKNQTNDTLKLGETTNDEMCNIFGMYYPTDGNVWNCLCLGESCSATRLNR